MAQFPALPLFTDAYLADTEHLSDAEHGIYLRVLMVMWRSPGCRIPDDDEWIARRFRRDVETVRTLLRPVLREFCSSDGNWIIQKRLMREWKWCQKKSAANTVSAKSRWNKDKHVSERNANTHSERNAPYLHPTLPKESKEDSTPPPLRYAFESGVIRLNARDFERWKSAYPDLSLEAELEGLAGWASEQKNWFNAVAGALTKKQRQSIDRRNATFANGHEKPLTYQELFKIWVEPSGRQRVWPRDFAPGTPRPPPMPDSDGVI
jgi:uncharacterized protein YdaU (DUF1376 family)